MTKSLNKKRNIYIKKKYQENPKPKKKEEKRNTNKKLNQKENIKKQI